MARVFLLLGLLFFIVACTSTPSPMGKPLPHMDYSGLTPYMVWQGHIEVRKTYLEYEKPSQVNFVRSPDLVLENYSAHRFDQKTGMRRMVFDIQKLSLTKQIKEMKYFDSLFGNKKDIYDFNLFVTMIPLSNQGRAMPPYTIDIKRKLVLTPDLSIAEREFRQFEFLEKTISDLDKAVNDIVTKINR